MDAIPQSVFKLPPHGKRWTVGFIRQELGLNASTYGKLYAAVERCIEENGLLGERINTYQRKQTAIPLLDKISDEFTHLFDGATTEWRRYCMLAIAQMCNQNFKRSVDQRSRQRKQKQHRMQVGRKKSTREWFLATWSDGSGATVIRMEEVQSPESEARICLDKLIKVLGNELGFEEDQDVLRCDGDGFGSIHIHSESALHRAVTYARETEGTQQFRLTLHRSMKPTG